MYKGCLNLLYGIFYIGVIDFALSQQKGPDKSVNLALETVFEFDNNGKSDIHLLNNVQNFIGKVKNVLERKHIERRQTGTDQRNVFTNFILNIVNVLSKFEDNELERFFSIINNEIQRYCEEDDDIHILNKYGLFKSMPAYTLRRYLKTIANKIEEEAYLENEKAIIDGVNYIFKQDDTTKFDKFVSDLDEYRRKSRRNIDLVEVIKSALRSIFLDTYYRFEPTAKTVLRTILHNYFGSFISLPTKYPVLQPSSGVKRAKLKTTKEFRTWRQMYVEKNLDLKYPTDSIPVVTKKHKRKDKTRTKKLHIMTMPTTRAMKIGRHRKGKKEYDINIDTSKHTDNSDEESNSNDDSYRIKPIKTTFEYFYKRYFDRLYGKPTSHKNINKLSTFYLDLGKLSTTSYAKQRFEFTTGIKHGKYWNSHQKGKKSKHYGYIQKQRKNVFSHEQQIHMNKKDPEMVRMPPMSLNMQLSITKEPSTLDNGVGDTTFGVEYINEDARNPLSEEGLSIEGFQEIKRKMYNRRSDNHNNTANNHVLNLIQKIEQDLEAVKTKIHNTSVFENLNNLDNITKAIKNDVNKFKVTINKDKSVNQDVINVRKFYEERSMYDVDNIKNFSLRDEKNTAAINMAARKTFYDQKLYPVVRAREANSDEIIIHRKYAPLEKALPKSNDHDSKENNNSIITINFLNEKTKNEKHKNGTILKVSANTNLEDKIFDKAKDNKTLPNQYINVKLTGEKINIRNTKENATKHGILTVPNNIKNKPKFRSQLDEINKIENVTLKEMTTPKSVTSVTNYKNITDSAITVDNFITTEKVNEVTSNENNVNKPAVKEIDQRHIESINNNETIVPKLDTLKVISPTDNTTVNEIEKTLPDKTS